MKNSKRKNILPAEIFLGELETSFCAPPKTVTPPFPERVSRSRGTFLVAKHCKLVPIRPVTATYTYQALFVPLEWLARPSSYPTVGYFDLSLIVVATK